MSYKTLETLISLVRQKKHEEEDSVAELKEVLEGFTVKSDYREVERYEAEYNTHYFKVLEYEEIISELHEELTLIRYRLEKEKEN